MRLGPAIFVCAAVAAGCGGDTVEGPAPAAPDTIRLSSPAFDAGATLQKRFTCDGEDVSPPLAWSRVPSGARELALTMEDPDAPHGTFVHWSVSAIPPGTHGLAEDRVPGAAVEGENSFGKDGWRGPCPPDDDRPHRYVFTLYALPKTLGLDEGAKPDDVRSAIADASPLARGRLRAKYGR